MAVPMVEISEKTAVTLKKMLSTAIEKKNWMRENKPEVWEGNEKLQARMQDELDAYRELEEALAP